ncbi:MAG: DUF1428 domain-containing protein [Candidatus Aenigmarchaeota archaeon]|nr:DUF1428 domain-containing protein [Candidatus Aenigmarchaeota archaeon]
MTYVDGFVIPIKKENVSAYLRMAKWGARMWKKHGALDYYETVGDDLRVKKGIGQGFRKLAKLKPGETVVFSFIVYKSRKHRDEVNKKVMSDPSMKDMEKMMKDMGQIMDMKRFAYGGFKTIVEW